MRSALQVESWRRSRATVGWISRYVHERISMGALDRRFRHINNVDVSIYRLANDCPGEAGCTNHTLFSVSSTNNKRGEQSGQPERRLTRVFEIKGSWPPPGYLRRSALTLCCRSRIRIPTCHSNVPANTPTMLMIEQCHHLRQSSTPLVSLSLPD
jgi:ribosomal protein L44E